MPGRDGTGPAGAGPMTGGGWGDCGPRGITRGIGWGVGRGRGFARGRGRGFGWNRGTGFGRGLGFVGGGMAGGPAPYAADGDSLRRQLDAIEDQLSSLREQLADRDAS